MYHVIHKTPMGIIQEQDVHVSTIQEVVDLMNIPVNQFPTVCMLGDIPVLRKYWKTIDIDIDSLDYELGDREAEIYARNKGNKILTFVTYPQGDLFKNILALVATLALSIIAPGIGTAIAGAIGVTSALGIQLITAGVMIAGSFLIGTFLKPSTPSVNTPEAASPTYSLSAQGNQARLFQPIPKLYGKHIIYSDYASGPYTEYIGNDLYLNQLFCVGLGTYQIHEARIEDTAYWNETDGMLPAYTGITQQIVNPGQRVTLFHSQVITSVEVSQQDLNNWQVDSHVLTFTASNKRITTQSDQEGGQFRLTKVGQKVRVRTGTNAGVYTVNSISTDYTWIAVNEALVNATYETSVELYQDDNWVGPYVANTANTITNKIQADFILPQGLFSTNDDANFRDASAGVQVQARRVDSAGLPISGWQVLGNHTYTASTPTPQRFTESYDVLDGRYEVRVRRTDFESVSSRTRNTIQWGALKAFIPNDNIYPDVTLIAVRMLATGQLTESSSKRINFIATAKLPIWNPSTNSWSAPTPTKSIAWAVADIARNTVYGAEFADEYIDLDKLVELDAKWAARGDAFNAIFDTTYSVWEALTLALRCGRATPILIGGKLTFSRDEAKALPRGVFTPANIVRGTFETRHIIYDDENPDDIIVQFVDERTWKSNEVQCTQPGSNSEKPQRVEIFGITNRLQAWREGMFMGAVNSKRRVVSTFDTEMEGRILIRGDLISVAHDLYSWGDHGVIELYEANNRIVHLSEPVSSTNSQQYMLIRKRNGSGWGPVKVNRIVGNDFAVQIDATDLAVIQGSQGNLVDILRREGDSSETIYILADASTEYKDFIIIAGKAKDEKVTLTGLLEDPSVHLADQGSPPPDNYPYDPNLDPTRPIINQFSANEDPQSNPDSPRVKFAWSSDSQVRNYRLLISYDNITWDSVYYGPNKQFTTNVNPGTVYARVVAIFGQAGPIKSLTKVFGIDSSAPYPVQGITVKYSISGGDVSIGWKPSLRAESYRMNMYSESVVNSGVFDTLELVRSTPLTTIQLDSDDVLSAGGPWQNVRIGVVAVNSKTEAPIQYQVVTGIVAPQPTNLSLSNTYTRKSFTVQWSTQRADSFIVRIIVDGVAKLNYTARTNSQLVSLDDMQDVGGPWRVLTVQVTAKLGSLTSPATTLVVIANSIVPISGAGGSVSGSDVTLNWFQTSDNGVDRTRVRANTVNDYASASIVDTQVKSAGSAVTFTQTGLAPGTYYYWITAWDSTRNVESTPVQIIATV